MAIADVNEVYMNLLTFNKYTSRTSNFSELEQLKEMYSVYLSESAIPDKKHTHLLALLVAHHYALDDTQDRDQGGSDMFQGTLTSEREGDVSMGYSGPPISGDVKGFNAWLALTRYGMAFLGMMKTFKATPQVTT